MMEKDKKFLKKIFILKPIIPIFHYSDIPMYLRN